MCTTDGAPLSMTTCADYLLALVLFMAPAYAANMAAPFARFWKGWNRPVHGRLLGSHKTVAGIVLGVLAAFVTMGLQALGGLYTRPLVDYRDWPVLALGFGFGAMAGDAIKSGLKRRLGRPPGARWVPADQIDFVLGALVLVGPFASLAVPDVFVILAVTFIGDLVVNQVAFRLRIKETPW